MKSITKTNILFLALVLFYLLGSFFINLVPPKYLNTNFLLTLGQILIIIPALFYLLLTKFKPIKDIKIKRLKISNVLIIILLTYLCLPLLTFLNYISMFFVENKVVGILGVLDGNPLWLNLLFIAVMPAVFEEFVFRGLFYHSYGRRNILRASITSAFLFGLIHLNINQFLYAFAIGIIFSFVIEATGSIFSSVLMHFIFNANSVVIYYLSSKLLNVSDLNLSGQLPDIVSVVDKYQLIITAVFLALGAIIGTILAILVYYWLCRRNGRLDHVKNIIKNPNRKKINKDFGRILDIWLVSGMVLCIIYIIIYEIR